MSSLAVTVVDRIPEYAAKRPQVECPNYYLRVRRGLVLQRMLNRHFRRMDAQQRIGKVRNVREVV